MQAPTPAPQAVDSRQQYGVSWYRAAAPDYRDGEETGWRGKPSDPRGRENLCFNARVSFSLRRLSDSSRFDAAARWGLAARAVIYVLMAVLAGQVATGNSGREADQRGALNEVAHRSGGRVVLWLLAVGFVGYALWRFSEAAFGVSAEPGTGPRLKSAVRGAVYTSFAVTTVLIAAGSSGNQSQEKQQQTLTARAMHHTGGRLLVGLIGVSVLAVGVSMVYEGVTKKFEEHLQLRKMSVRTRKVVTVLGVVGTVARGLVFGLAGALVLDAAISYQPAKAAGLDGALRTLADQPFGLVLLSAAALGLLAFGVYGFAEARWQRT